MLMFKSDLLDSKTLYNHKDNIFLTIDDHDESVTLNIGRIEFEMTESELYAPVVAFGDEKQSNDGLEIIGMTKNVFNCSRIFE
ncbi:MAG: hypothetical protein MHMPM18_003919 [Marteilia pararefringens]